MGQGNGVTVPGPDPDRNKQVPDIDSTELQMVN